MKHESWSIMGACFLGAFIGTLIALDISACFQYGSYFWGIGALLGGIVAYAAVDFKRFCAGVRRAYNEIINWRPDRVYWKTYFFVFGGFSVIFMTAISMLFVPLIWRMNLPGVVATTLFLFSIFLASVLAFAVISRNKYESKVDYTKRLERNRDDGWKMMCYGNPIGMLYWMLVGFGWVAVRTPHAVKMGALTAHHAVINGVRITKLFVARVFIHVHSERRTLCFVDATLGAAIGYSFGSAAIGAIAGAVLGVVNYELISVRWLSLPLSPCRQS